MTPNELRAALAELGLSLREFAALVGRDAGTVYRWSGGTRRIPRWAEVVLREMRAQRKAGANEPYT